MLNTICVVMVGIGGLTLFGMGATGRLVPVDVYRSIYGRCFLMLLGLLLIAGAADQLGRMV